MAEQPDTCSLGSGKSRKLSVGQPFISKDCKCDGYAYQLLWKHLTHLCVVHNKSERCFWLLDCFEAVLPYCIYGVAAGIHLNRVVQLHSGHRWSDGRLSRANISSLCCSLLPISLMQCIFSKLAYHVLKPFIFRKHCGMPFLYVVATLCMSRVRELLKPAAELEIARKPVRVHLLSTTK
jgi:hypothetical protein